MTYVIQNILCFRKTGETLHIHAIVNILLKSTERCSSDDNNRTIYSEKNIWDRKWHKGEKTEQDAYRRKDTVALQQTKTVWKQERFEGNMVKFLLHFTEVLTWKYYNKIML